MEEEGSGRSVDRRGGEKRRMLLQQESRSVQVVRHIQGVEDGAERKDRREHPLFSLTRAKDARRSVEVREFSNERFLPSFPHIFFSSFS